MRKEKFHRTLFVYSKDGKVKCLSPGEAAVTTLGDKGWVHTATIDPARWIEAISNGLRDPSDALDELQFSKK